MLQQQKNFTESLGDLCQCVTKPMIDLTRLNIETFNHLASNSGYVENFIQAKKPEDILAAQIRFTNAASLEAFKYMQKATSILMEAANQNGRMFTEMSKQSAETSRAAEESWAPQAQPHRKTARPKSASSKTAQARRSVRARNK